MIGIIDYDAGNIKSVEKALQYLGQETVVSRDPQVLLKADKVILPGVGSFGDAMENLNKYGLVQVIHEIANVGNKKTLEGTVDLFLLKFKAKRQVKFGLKIIDGLLVDKRLNTRRSGVQ